jgi:hypothetical protein
MIFLHIPKTGGTSLKYTLLDNPSNTLSVFPNEGHAFSLSDIKTDCCFAIRDPWERFCSGFWERATMRERRKISHNNSYKSFGYSELTPAEENIIKAYNTPNDLCKYIRASGQVPGILNELTSGVCRWLHVLDEYKKYEHNIKLVFDIKDLTKISKEKFGIELYTDSFRTRSRNLFNKEQSYDVEPDVLNWFKNVLRKNDYELIDYIKQRDYYV